jgi:hypothetical protein
MAINYHCSIGGTRLAGRIGWKMNSKTGPLVLGFFLAGLLPLGAQTLAGKAAGDFYSAFAKMGINEKRLNSLEDLKPFIPPEVLERLKENLVYRTAFIAYAANQHGIIAGITSSVGFAETLNALTGFLMVLEQNGDLTEWTIKEISGRYEQLFASSWRNVNPTLFTVMLEAYCSYMRGELWKPPGN